jgi:hypothetical protein
MRGVPRVLAWIGAFVVLAAPSASGQTSAVPKVSARQYTGGSATVSVRGATEFSAEVPLNTQASMSDGEMTWLQFGASGSEAPNALITYSLYEVGVSAGKGKFGGHHGWREAAVLRQLGGDGKRDLGALHLPGHHLVRRRHRQDGHGGYGHQIQREVLTGWEQRAVPREAAYPRFACASTWATRRAASAQFTVGATS